MINSNQIQKSNLFTKLPNFDTQSTVMDEEPIDQQIPIVQKQVYDKKSFIKEQRQKYLQRKNELQSKMDQEEEHKEQNFVNSYKNHLQSMKKEIIEKKKDEKINNSDLNTGWKDDMQIVRLDGITKIRPEISKKQYQIHFLYQQKGMKPRNRTVRFGDREKEFYVDHGNEEIKTKRLQRYRNQKFTPFDGRYWEVWLLNSERNIQQAVANYKIKHNLL